MATATLTHERLIERAHIDLSRIDRENGVIRGVRIIGRISKNGREYSAEALRQARNLYEGVRVNIDHQPRSRAGDDTPSSSRFGWLANVRERDGGLIGDLHILKSHPMAAVVFEAAERNSSLFGLSHHAEGRTRREGGKTIVEEILAVRSVDLVSDPATTSGLFESVNMRDEYPSDPQSFAKALTAPSYANIRNPFKLREAEDAKAGEIIGDEVGDLAIAEKRIGDVIRQIAERRDISAAQRAKAVERLGALLDKIRSNYLDIDAEIAAVLKELPDKAEAAAMERAGQSSESLTRYLTGEARGGVGLRESASESKARSFTRSIT